VHKVSRAQAALQQRLGRQPRVGEIVEETGFTEKEVIEALRVGQPEAYLDDLLSQDDGRSFLETLPDDPGKGTEVELEERSRREDIHRTLEILPEREAYILRLYYGMNGQPPLTLEQIGQRMSLTRERIRQLKERALKRLRQEEEAVGVLKDYYDAV